MKGKHLESLAFIGSLLKSKRCNPLKKKEEISLISRAQAGDLRARRRVIEANMRFALHLALQYRGRGVDVADLFQEGSAALSRAVDGFDTTKNVKFISYAVWWVRQRILITISEQSRVYTMPARASEISTQMEKQTSRLAQNLQRLPTTEELGATLGLNRSKMDEWKMAINGAICLDAPLEGGDATPLDILEDGNADPTDHQAEQGSDDRYLCNILDRVSSKEAKVLRDYYQGERTLEEIGVEMGLSKERVRQVRARALVRARARSRRPLTV